MTDYILYGEKSEYFIFGIGFYLVFFVIPVAYYFAKDIFDENRFVKNIFYIVMLIYLLYFAFAIITESVFQWPGMGLLFIQAIGEVDIPVMAAYLVLIAFFFVVINMVVDILYFVVDPRLRIDKALANGQ